MLQFCSWMNISCLLLLNTFFTWISAVYAASILNDLIWIGLCAATITDWWRLLLIFQELLCLRFWSGLLNASSIVGGPNDGYINIFYFLFFLTLRVKWHRISPWYNNFASAILTPCDAQWHFFFFTVAFRYSNSNFRIVHHSLIEYFVDDRFLSCEPVRYYGESIPVFLSQELTWSCRI